MKILITDTIAQVGVDTLKQNFLVEEREGLSEQDLASCIGEYDAIIVRRNTPVTAKVIEAGDRLKVIGRAGVFMDNIDVEAATQKGIMVINAPEGNTVAAVEHTYAMLLSLARHIPLANKSLKAKEWNRSKFTGTEITGKTIGIIGLGRVGGEVAKRAPSFGLRVIAYDPYISPERAEKLGVKLLSVEEVFKEADFITLHLPRNKQTYHMIGEKELALMQPGAKIINCSRGGLIDEKALYHALQEGQISGAALDVFETEPAVDSPLLALDNVIVTPHVRTMTREAQENVSLQVAREVSNALLGRPVVSAVNVAIVPPETLGEVKPFLPLMKILGQFYMQIYGGHIEEVEVSYAGEIASYPVAPLTNSCLIGLLSIMLGESVNYVNAPVIAKQRGIKVREVTSKSVEDFTNLVTLKVKGSEGERVLAGTIFRKNDARIVQIDNHHIEVVPSEFMLLTRHADKPGIIGKIGGLLGTSNINIAGMQLGRKSVGGEAVMVVQVDSPVPDETLNAIKEMEAIMTARFVRLDKSL